jgi:hypothetical protein
MVASAVLACTCMLVACSRADSSDSGAAATENAADAAVTAELASLRTANERFNDVNVALAEGYMPDPTGMCVTADMTGEPSSEGAMGLHYFRPDLLGITSVPEPPARVTGSSTYTDFSKPAILMYEPQADGSLKLVGIENLVFADAWKQAGNASPPSSFGKQWFEMTDNPDTPVDEAHGFASHYDLHVWLYRDNPTGVYSQFNPAVSCEHGMHMTAGAP